VKFLETIGLERRNFWSDLNLYPDSEISSHFLTLQKRPVSKQGNLL